MTVKGRSIVPLSEMINNQEGIFFAVLSGRTPGVTKEGKPYFKVFFRDALREVQAFIWSDGPLYNQCRETWIVGHFYKIGALFRQTDYGPKIEIRRIREAVEKDAQDGFSPRLCRPTSRVEPAILFDELLSLLKNRIGKGPLLLLVQRIFKEHRARILDVASSREHHHAFFGGMLEHALSATKIAAFLADHFETFYPDLMTRTVSDGGQNADARPVLDKRLCLAGAALHEIGKIDEMLEGTLSPQHSLAGELVGYPVLGRDLIRRYAPAVELDDETRLRLEHILLTHPRFADWGAVAAPRTPEAVIVHLADYADSNFAVVLKTLAADRSDEPFTLQKGPFGGTLFKQPAAEKK